MPLSIFNNQNIAHLLELFFWMFGAFLIGWFFAKSLYSKMHQEEIKEYKSQVELFEKEISTTIKARKTYERSGIEVKKIASISDKTVPDDLQQIKGIGPVLESKLNELGVFTYEQIANLSEEDIDKIVEVTTFGKNKINADDWKGQAKKLLNLENN
jgi:predicted flap endonuclease-1-like 5' DNA nuclease